MKIVAERELILVAGKQRRPVIVKLGQPYWMEQGIEAVCPVSIEGMLNGATQIHGMDLLDAIECVFDSLTRT